jgi:hypothetical protein
LRLLNAALSFPDWLLFFFALNFVIGEVFMC